MKNNVFTLIAGMVLCIGSGIGCVSTGQPVAGPDAPKNPDALFATYMEAAISHEEKNNFLESLESYRLAQVVKPDDKAAGKGRIKMETAVTKKAKTFYKQGLRLYKQGRFEAANERFLAALRLRPDYPEPLARLRPGKRIHASRFVIYTIETGDSLSILSKKYYGSFDHFDVIAHYNGIEDATQVRLGQKIKIPEIDGLPFNADTPVVQSVPASGMNQEDTHASSYQETETEMLIEETFDQTDIYKDQGISLFKQKEYGEAAFEFLKVLSAKPDDKETRDYLSQCYFQQGVSMLDQNNLKGARDKLHKALSYNPDCRKCSDTLKECDILTKEWHYTRGITFFEKEQPTRAIAEWRLVEAIDPAYKQVMVLIKRAETILKNLEVIKKSVTNPN